MKKAIAILVSLLLSSSLYARCFENNDVNVLGKTITKVCVKKTGRDTFVFSSEAEKNINYTIIYLSNGKIRYTRTPEGEGSITGTVSASSRVNFQVYSGSRFEGPKKYVGQNSQGDDIYVNKTTATYWVEAEVVDNRVTGEAEVVGIETKVTSLLDFGTVKQTETYIYR